MLSGYGLARSMFRGNCKANIVKHSGTCAKTGLSEKLRLCCTLASSDFKLQCYLSFLMDWA